MKHQHPIQRILHVTHETGWRGGERQLLSLIMRQKERGRSVGLAAPPGAEICRRAIEIGVKVFTVAMRSDLDLVSAWTLARIIRLHHPEVIHAHSGRSHAVSALARAIAVWRAPLVTSRRVSFPLKTNWLNRMKYRSADRYLAVSHAAAEALYAAGVDSNRIDLAPDGVDPALFRESVSINLREEFQIPDGAFIIGNAAHFDDVKNQTMIVEAAPAILQRAPHTVFVLLGEGESRDAVVEKAKTLNVDASFRFPGFLDAIGRFYATIDLYVMVSREEGLCSSILEAQAFGKAIVATEAGGIPDIVRDGVNGRLVGVNDAEAFANAVAELIENEALRRQFGAAGRAQVVDGYTADAVAEITQACYQKAYREKTNLIEPDKQE